MTHEADAPAVPLLQRLATRLTLLLLAVVAVLAGATAILLWRGLDALRFTADGAALAGVDPEAIGAVARGTLINLGVIVSITLVAATAFSRALLAEPIAHLTVATRALAAGDRRVRAPVRDRSELGELAASFNAMADALAEAQDRLEARVAARTAELRALLDLSNTIAVTTELQPLLAAVLDRLDEAGATSATEVWELGPDGGWARLVARGGVAEAPPSTAADAVVDRDPAVGDLLSLPLRVRDRTVGLLRARAARGEGWDDERVRWARGVAAQAAVAIENVRLYERARDEATEEARRHLARELHDSVSQAIYAIVLTTHAAQARAERDPAKARAALDTVVELAEAALAEMRALIFELRPEALAEVGLIGALHRQLDGLELRHGLATERDLGEEPTLPFATKQVLLRVVQEALHNVVKHARARLVAVRTYQAGGRLHVEVRDDGVGFDPHGSFPGHLGHTSMRERLGALGGHLRLDSAPGTGTRVSLDLPLAPTEAP